MRPVRDSIPVILLGERLKALRKQRGLTQQGVADRLRVDRTTYTKYENGRVCPDQQGLVMLAELFGVTVDFLLGRDDLPAAPVLEDDGGAMALQLTEQEKLLLQMFRQLSPAEREELTKTARIRFMEQREARWKQGS